MTPHHWATLSFVVLLGTLFIVDLSYMVPWWGYGILLLLFGFLVVMGSARIDSGYHVPAYCHGPRNSDMVSLSFDDGPDPEVTPKVLDLLRERGVRASFFLIGEKVEAHPDVVARINREGQFLGGHSWDHSYVFDLYPTRWVLRGIRRCGERIASITGHYPRAFRPPYGVTNPMIRRAVDRSDSIVVGWDIRSFDTSLNARQSVQRVLKRVRGGSLILLHDTDENVVRILPELLKGIEDKGYRPVPLEELLQMDLSYVYDASLA